MRFVADLHVHSKHSRATSRDCDLEHLSAWARRKGIAVVATGDFTHPAWFDEIREKLVPAEPGLFRLRPELERAVDEGLPPICRGPTRFLLEVEISTIYKKGEKTRKVHHLVYAATLETAGRFRERLGAIGNIASDGRPILGLDSRHLLEIVLESGPDAYLVPAHVWTPWFAALGSKSGFDSIEACYGDLAPHIFAVETGLSSDPPMNWRVSSLDRYTLVSSSDAHSPPMLGREASVFDTDLDYFAIRRALETGEGYGGTLEFFPEEGKYHLDGHRACGVRLEPGETRARDGSCPACGKPVTVGVLHRVEVLADRPPGHRAEGASPFRSLVPLPEIISELRAVGPKSKRVRRTVDALVAKLGPELEILERLPIDELERAAGELPAEAIRRLRAGDVRCEGGYDGEYGTIRLFDAEELAAQMALFAPRWDGLEEKESQVPGPSREGAVATDGAPATGASDEGDSRAMDPSVATAVAGSDAPEGPAVAPSPAGASAGPLARLDPDQRAAAEVVEGPLLVLAGPGTGKTRTLTHRIAHLVERGADPRRCLALTFTRRAADEMAERLGRLLPGRQVTVDTFHGLGLSILRERHADVGLERGFRVADDAARLELVVGRFGLDRSRGLACLSRLAAERRTGQPASGRAEEVTLDAYRTALLEAGLVDFEELLQRPAELLEERPDLLTHYRARYRWISVDEYQDVDPLQYRLLRWLAPADGNLCAIGDPDQSIYRFRGAEVGFFLRFREDYPAAAVVRLGRNYRSQPTVVEAALQLIAPSSLVPDRELDPVSPLPPSPVVVCDAATPEAEAELVVHSIEQLLGGTSYFSLDSGRVGPGAEPPADLSFDDFAVLYRTNAQAAPLEEALDRAGMPYQRRSHERLLDRQEVRRLVGEAAARAEGSPGRGAVPELLSAVGRELFRDEAARLDRLLELLAPFAERHADDLGAFLTELALGAEVDTWDPRAERISLLTLHASKGLEFPVVFVVGCEDGLVPMTWAHDDVDLDEERRLLFVGMTRARSRLVLTRARRRPWRGTLREPEPSRFLAAVGEELVERRRAAPPKRAGRQGPVARQLDLL